MLVPTTAYIEYWDGDSWINAGDVPLAEDAFNTLALENIVTRRLRVSMLNTSESTGILEWRVYGTPAPEPEPEPDPDPVAQCDAYTWPGYDPDLDYDFRDEFKDIDPEKFEVFLGCDPSVVAGVKTSGRIQRLDLVQRLLSQRIGDLGIGPW